MDLNFPQHRSVGAKVRSDSTSDFLTRVIGPHESGILSRTNTALVVNHGHHLSGICPDLAPANFIDGTTSLLVQSVHQAYSSHLGFGLRPEVFWYAVINQIGEHVRLNQGRYRPLLGPDWTHGPRVVGANWGKPEATFERLHKSLEATLGPELTALFVPPQLTTVDGEAGIALMTAFMEAAGSYHEYRLPTLCGIRRIRIEGTAKDWALLGASTRALQEHFPLLHDYLEGVWYVLHSIHSTVGELESYLGEFWESIYSWQGGTGDGPRAQGWVTSLFAHRRSEKGPQPRTDFLWWDRKFEGFSLGQFSSHITALPIIQTGTNANTVERHLIGGVLGVDIAESDGGVPVLTPRLGWGMVRKD